MNDIKYTPDPVPDERTKRRYLDALPPKSAVDEDSMLMNAAGLRTAAAAGQWLLDELAERGFDPQYNNNLMRLLAGAALGGRDPWQVSVNMLTQLINSNDRDFFSNGVQSKEVDGSS